LCIVCTFSCHKGHEIKYKGKQEAMCTCAIRAKHCKEYERFQPKVIYKFVANNATPCSRVFASQKFFSPRQHHYFCRSCQLTICSSCVQKCHADHFVDYIAVSKQTCECKSDCYDPKAKKKVLQEKQKK
jgi:hypothetical protein